MKRFFAKIGRFFWSWGFLKFVLGMIALIILFYIEEDWRGARAWAATKAKWEAKGESFDFNRLIPRPVPDDQNLAAIPLFKIEALKATDGRSYLSTVVLDRAVRIDFPSIDFPRMGDWQRGELPDMAKFRDVIAADYAIVFKGTKPPDDTFAQFNAIYPFLTDFLAAATTRPLFRLNMDYAVSPPCLRGLEPVVRPIKLSQILTLHAILALDHHQSDLALEDIRTNYKLLSGVKRDPTLVGGLVAIGINAINDTALYDGLAHHEWNNAQLVALEQTLKPINFLADYQFAMRSELAYATATSEFLQHMHRSDLARFPGAMVSDVPVIILFDVPWPSGWWDQNKRHEAAYLFRAVANVDPKSRLVFPKMDKDLQYQIEQANDRWDACAPWKILANIAAGPVVRATQKFAQAQVWIDEARIACALERYRLAHGVYPGSLDALAPAYIDALPHDIMNGQPYHYQLRPDGTFLLYSVGWNQTDDGGKVGFKKDARTLIDYSNGDWVWPTPK